MLKIPRITANYIRRGFNNFDDLDDNPLTVPDISLNFHYPDCVMFALLMEIKKPKNILDFGSYFGLLPILSEHLFKLYGNGQKFNWTLVDDCSYVKELAYFIKRQGNLSNTLLTNQHVETWKISNMPLHKSAMFEQHGEYCVPPTTPEEFYKFWAEFTNYYRLDNPSKSMFTNLELVPSECKFDLVMFDLAAENYDVNLEMWKTLTNNYINDDAIVVMDDVLPRHPKAMSLFLHILDTTEFSPVAFSAGKIAMMKKQHKEEFINKVNQAGLIAKSNAVSAQEYFNFFVNNTYKWGTYLNLKAN